MKKSDFERITAALNELSLFIFECMQKEYPEQTQKALNNKRLFDFPTLPPDEREKNTIKILKSLSTEEVAPMRIKEVLQVNNGNKFGNTEIFNKKEIKAMPKLKDLSYRYKEKNNLHEFRYRKSGLNKSFSSTNFKEAKRKALEFIRELNEYDSLLSSNDVNFIKFAENYLNTVKKKNVTEKTFKNDYNRFTNYVVPTFKHLKLKDVKAPFIQRFLNDVLDKGQKRTAEGLYYILKSILDYAVNTELITRNPLCAVKIPLHERVNGSALPLETEKEFLKKIAGTKYELHFIISLYTGCRPCELETVAFNTDGFITFRNLKQKKKAVVYKDIPITPMLAPYVERIKKALPLEKNCNLAKIFSSFVPGYKYYDLRHTFATRCQTCGVPQEIVGRWLGHKSNKITDNVYTHFPPKFMLEQAKKVEY